jgi:serine/threonine-protein kinase HipA
MSLPPTNSCPGTLAIGYSTYSTTCLRRLFLGRKVHHVLPFPSPYADSAQSEFYRKNQQLISVSGVQEKYFLVLDKNKLRLAREGEQSAYILKPIPSYGNNKDQMPANEHLTMQLARQVFNIQTAENALIFFEDGSPAYITKRFDLKYPPDSFGKYLKWASEDFASLAGRTPQTHGEHYKYQGSYLELFDIMKMYLPAYRLEAVKLFRLLIFNYLFSNGDAHFKNFSILETELGDFSLSPAYDLLNTRLHVKDADFALEDGLLPRSNKPGSLKKQFIQLGKSAGLTPGQIEEIIASSISKTEKVTEFVEASFLKPSARRHYLQTYLKRIKKLR